MPEPRPGTTLRYFGDYLLLGEIASGGMGVVYRARQVRLNRSVALKMIRSGQLASGSERSRFRTEAEAAATLDHPNIVPIYEVNEYEGQPYLSMKLIEGESLAERMPSDGGRRSEVRGRTADLNSLSSDLRLLAKVAHAVHHAHQRGVLHRDLKPANILLDELAEPHLTDFGLAKLLDSDHGQTHSQAVLGTPAYMAPEVAAGGAKRATTASDLYSLGAILYEMLAGQPPFLGDTPQATLEQIRTRDVIPPRRVNLHVPPDLETICLKCLEREPARRYSSAEALAEDIDCWLHGKPIRARPVTAWERTVKWTRRNPIIASLSVAVTLSIFAGLVAVTWQWRKAEHARAATAHVNARLRLQRAEDLFASDNASLALAVLARALRDDPDFRAAEERLVNAFNHRRFLVPAVSSTNAPLLSDPQITFRSVQSSDAALSALVTNKISIVISANEPPLELRLIEAAHAKVIRSIAFNSDRSAKRLLASASADATAKIWEVHNHHESVTLPHPAAVASVEFSPDNKSLATGCGDGSVRLWDVSTRQIVAEWPGHRGAVNIARFTPDGLLLASGGEDGFVRVWRLADGQPSAEPLSLSKRVDDLRFSVDGKRLFIRVEGGATHEFTFTQVAATLTSTPQPPIPNPTAEPIPVVLGVSATNFHPSEVTCTNLSPDGKLLVTASTDQTARMWDARTRQPLTDPLLHDATVNYARFSRDGFRVVTSTANRMLRVWDSAIGAPLTDWIVAGESVDGAGFSADGTHAVASTGRAWLIHVAAGAAPIWLPELAESMAGLRITEAGLTESVPAKSFLDLKQNLPTVLAAKNDSEWVQRIFGGP